MTIKCKHCKEPLGSNTDCAYCEKMYDKYGHEEHEYDEDDE